MVHNGGTIDIGLPPPLPYVTSIPDRARCTVVSFYFNSLSHQLTFSKKFTLLCHIYHPIAREINFFNQE